MNKEALIQVAEWLEAGAPHRPARMRIIREVNGFDMSNWFGSGPTWEGTK